MENVDNRKLTNSEIEMLKKQKEIQRINYIKNRQLQLLAERKQIENLKEQKRMMGKQGCNLVIPQPSGKPLQYLEDTEPFDLNHKELLRLGFSNYEIGLLVQIHGIIGRIITNKCTQIFGLDYERAQRIKYAYDISTGRVIINTDDDLVRHLRKMFGQHRRIGIGDLDVSRIKDVPRTALVSGLEAPYDIWNSTRDKCKNKNPMYRVVDVRNHRIVIVTDKIPVLKYGTPKYIPNVLEIIKDPKDGLMEVAIDKKYCRLCNRFVIVASLRKPEFHNGMVEIIALDGTRVYVFADTMKAKSYSRYGNSTQRIYDYGYFSYEITPKLCAVANAMSKKLRGFKCNFIKANTDFKLLVDEETNNFEGSENIEDENI